MDMNQEKKAPLGQVKVEPGEKIETNQDIKIIAAIGYFWILCLLPLLAKRDSEFAQHHGKQGLVLTICSFILWLVAWIPVIGWVVGFLGTIVLIVFSVLGILHALQGKYWEMPYLGEYAKKIKL
jgi:uncharacterized membrane protein